MIGATTSDTLEDPEVTNTAGSSAWGTSSQNISHILGSSPRICKISADICGLLGFEAYWICPVIILKEQQGGLQGEFVSWVLVRFHFWWWKVQLFA
jgi:hypothetical protein